MTTYERLVSELGDGLGIDFARDDSGVVEMFADGHAVLLRADETGECELTAFTVLAVAPEGGFPPETLRRALEMDLFGREVAGHHLGLFADSLILSASLPITGLTAEDLADRIVMLARLAGELSGSLERPSDVPVASGGTSSLDGPFMTV